MSRLLLPILVVLPALAQAVDVPGTAREQGTLAPLSGWVVSYPGATSENQATVGEDGSFLLVDAPAGTTQLQILSSTGVAFGSFDFAGGRADLLVEPSGHVFASDTGAPADGVTVELSRAGGGLVSSQVTDKHGLYRFTVPGPGGYRLNVRTDGQRWHFPSKKLPAAVGDAVFDATTFQVDAPAAPDPNAPRSYWLAFEAATGQTVAPRHNHIAVDRGGAVVAIQKTASKHQVQTGDVITYTVRVENRSAKDFLRSESTGGVIVRDVLPEGVRLVSGSARAAVDGVPVTLAELRHPRILEFQLSNFDAGGRAFELKAAGSIVLRYQVAVGVNAREGAMLTNRATVVDPGGIALSDTVKSEVRVTGNPLFDRSWIRGRVYCDEDGDKWAGATDPGVYGARIYLDTGRYVVTDREGRFHLSDVPPGVRLVKIDTDTVSPGSEPVTPISRTLHVTRGIPQQVSFGFRCSTVQVGPSEVIPAEKDQPLPPSERLVVTGSVTDLTVSAEGELAKGKGSAKLALAGDQGKEILDVPWSPRVLPSPIKLGIAGPEGVEPTVWRLWIEWEDDQNRWHPLRAWGGEGAPPTSAEWDGTDASGRTVVARRGALHRARLEIADGSSRWHSVPVWFTVGRTRATASDRSLFPGAARDRRGRLSRKLTRGLAKLGRSLKTRPGVEVLVEVAAPADGNAAAVAAGYELAAAVARELVKKGNLSPLRVGLSVTVGEPQVTVRVYDPTEALPVKAAPRPAPPRARALVSGAEAPVDKAGRFVLAPARPDDGLIVVELRDKDGARRELLVSFGEARAPEVRAVRAALGEGKLQVGDQAIDLAALSLRVRANYDMIGLIDGAPEKAIEFRLFAPEKVATWRLAVTGPGGAEVFAKEGEGQPPTIIPWVVGEGGMEAGDYVYGAEIVTESAVTAHAPSRIVEIVAEPTGGARGQVIKTLRGSLFTTDHKLKRGLRKTLTALAADIKKLPAEATVLVEVHSAGDGAASVAKLGASTRAKRVASFLLLRGVREGRLTPVGVGNERPLATPDTASGRKNNTRVELRVVSLGRGPVIQGWGLKVDGRDVLLSKNGAAVARLPKGPGEMVAVEVAGTHGQRLVVEVDLPAAEEQAEAPLKTIFGIPTLARALKYQQAKDGPPPPLVVADLKVDLPPDGAELGQPILPIKGEIPDTGDIRVAINGQSVPVKNGRFDLLLPLENGEEQAVTIEATDKSGNVARISRSYKVKGNALFLMVLADGSLSQHGTKLDQKVSTVDLGPVLLHGRGALYLKARIKGGDIIKNVNITAYGDTARDRDMTNFVDQVIDPKRYYPVYGDASDEVVDAKTRGQYYVAVEADRSKLIVGTFKASQWGIELLRYDRVMEGAQVRLDQSWSTEGWDTVAEGFVNFADDRARRTHATLLATGGSYYFLPNKELIEGSEQVSLAIFDKDSGALLQRVAQIRDVDYRVDYLSGRITFKKPVSSRVDGSFPLGAVDLLSGRMGFEGHQVRIQVDYETREAAGFGDTTWGVNASQEFAGYVTVGGGYVREGRGAGQGPDYELVGGHVRVTPSKKSYIEAEVARSTAGNGANFLSDDGGLSFVAVGEEPQQVAEGFGFTVRGHTDIGEFLGKKDPYLTVDAHWQRQDKGFVSSHSLLEQGAERGGLQVRWAINKHHQLVVRHDTLSTERDDFTRPDSLETVGRNYTSAQYTARLGRWTFVGDVAHTREAVEGDDAINRGGLSGIVKYRVNPRLSLFAEQQFIVGKGGDVLRSTGDHFVTGFGLDVTLTDDLALTVGERVRWSGEDASYIGLRTQLSENASMYVHQRLIHPRDSNRWIPATVVGSEERWGEDGTGRSYGEYQVGAGSTGSFNRAVLGLGRRFEVMPGFHADLAFERSHTNLVDGKGTERDMNTFSIGGEYLALDSVKIATRFEVRAESSDSDRLQLVSFNRVTADLGAHVALMGHVDVAITNNQDLGKREAESTNIGLAIAYRPLDETFSLLFRAAHMSEMRPVNLDPAMGANRTTAQVVSVEPIIELPLRLQITPKFAWRRMVEDVEQLDGSILSTESNTLLAALRLGFHVWQTLDIAAEYRFISVDIAEQIEHGALAEIAINITRFARIGVGYNFTSFSDDLFALDPRSAAEPSDPLSRIDHGFFVRLTGAY